MNHRSIRAAVALCAVFALSSTAPLPASTQPTPGLVSVGSEPSRAAPVAAPAWVAPAYPVAWTADVAFERLPPARLEAMRTRNATTEKALQVGVARMASEAIGPRLPVLRWIESGGGAVARLQVVSPDAAALRVGLRLASLPTRVEMRFAGARDPALVVARVDGASARSSLDGGDVYWTPPTDGEAQIIEFHAPRGVDPASVEVEVVSASHLFGDSRAAFRAGVAAAGAQACQVDAACRVEEFGPGYVAAKDAVALLMYTLHGASFSCTGTLLNDTDQSTQVPYLYTAYHCIPDVGVANTLVTSWRYEATTCGSTTRNPVSFESPSDYLHGDEDTDAVLLRMRRTPPTGTTFAGWRAAPVEGNVDVVGIHHPAGDLKKVSVGRTRGAETLDVLLAAGWLDGATEPGSSGSGLFVRESSDFLLVGGLLGGYSTCETTGDLSDPANLDYYSRFDVVFPWVHRYLSPGVGNGPPLPDFDVAAAGRVVQFQDGSVDHDGTIVAHAWDFGDGTGSTRPAPDKTYAADGTYEVTLTVTDDAGASLRKRREVHASADPGTRMWRGQGHGVSGEAGDIRRFYIDIPPGSRLLRLLLKGDNGDADLYVKRGAPPTLSLYDRRMNSPDSIEVTQYITTEPGRYHVMIHAFDAFTDGVVVVTYDGPNNDPPPRSDFDANRVSDVLWRDDTGGSIAWWPAARAQDARTSGRVGDPAWRIVAIGDLDGNGSADLFWRHAVTGANAAWPAADPTTAWSAGVVADQDWQVSGAGDFDGDGRDDVLWRNARTGANAIWNGGKAAGQRPAGAAPASWQVAAIADFDADGRDDVLWRNRVSGANVIWRSANPGATQAVTGVTNQAWQVVGAGDFDGDHRADILWRRGDTGAMAAWSGARYSQPIDVMGVADLGWEVVAIGDYSGDLQDDLMWRHATSGRNTIWMSANHQLQMGLPAVADVDWVVVD